MGRGTGLAQRYDVGMGYWDMVWVWGTGYREPSSVMLSIHSSICVQPTSFNFMTPNA